MAKKNPKVSSKHFRFTKAQEDLLNKIAEMTDKSKTKCVMHGLYLYMKELEEAQVKKQQQ